eukprot:NODE_908_length_3163_cov_0.507180.p1 type:complete len:270 gc:universal NODE_908_length_3163_cov_0.507180:2305-1496(-)
MLILFILGTIALRITASASGTDLISLTMTNLESIPVTIATASTPFSPLSEDVLEVVQEGYRARFLGVHVNWNYNDLEDVTQVLSPGESLKTVISISERYGTLNGVVLVRSVFPLRVCRQSRCTISTIKSNTLEISSAAYKSSKKSTVNPSFSLSNCSSTQTTNALAALNGFPLLADASLIYLNSTLGPRINEYFGSPKRNIIKAINVLSRSRNYLFDMVCGTIDICGSSSVYAFVYPNEPVVYFCDAFYKASNTGWDSRPGVLMYSLLI